MTTRTLIPVIAAALTLLAAPLAAEAPHPLSSQAMDATPIRAWLASLDRYALADGDWRDVDGHRDQPVDVAVLDEEALEILHCSYGICTRARVPDESLLLVPSQPTRILVQGTSFVEVAAGAHLTLHAPNDRGTRAVELIDETIEVRGRALPDDLGRTYIHPSWTAPPRNFNLVDSGQVFDRPGGEVIARVTTDEFPIPVAIELLSEEPEEGHLEVVFTHRLARIRGFVPEEHLHPRSPYHSSLAGAEDYRWGCSHCHTISLPEGILLFDQPEGNVIARTDRVDVRVELIPSDEFKGWLLVNYRSIWGAIPAYIPTDTPFEWITRPIHTHE